MELLPPFLAIPFIGMLGLIIGSFLDVVTCRFHTGKSVNGRSRCMSCGHTLSWYELFPLLSYLILRGRCKECGGHIPLRLLMMELSTASAFLFVYLNSDSLLHLGFGLVLMSLLIVIVLYDIRHMVIPNEFVVCAFVLASLFIGYEAYSSESLLSIAPHLMAGFGTSLFYAALWTISKGKWIGLGDAKLAFPLALMLTLFGAFSFVVLSFWIGAILSVAFIGFQKLLQSGKKHLPFLVQPLTMKSEVPFAPFMVVAFIVVFWSHVDVLSIMTNLF